MDNLIVLSTCEDGSCCCLPPRSTIALISILSFVASALDMVTVNSCAGCCPWNEYVESMRTVLLMLFQLANMLLLLASIIESSLLVNIYVWYTLGFVMMALCVSILELMLRVKDEGVAGVVTFVPEVVFIFVISRCLPLVNAYRKQLDGVSYKQAH